MHFEECWIEMERDLRKLTFGTARPKLSSE
jgi:hypothetical protein